MSVGRLLRVAALDLKHNAQRPLFWIFLLILALTSWGLSTGHMRISSGESVVGGTKAWLTSEFAMSQMLSMVILLFYGFFVAVAAGMSVIQDDDLKVGAVLHATPLTPPEYIGGKFFAVVASFLAVLAIHVGLAMFFNHLVPNEAADEIRGPFNLMNYLKPALWFGVPAIVFFAGTAFAAGVWSRKPILVFVLPVATLLACGFFLWNWSPSWLDPRVNRLLQAIEPAGFRWLNETWLKVDRGVHFYNRQPMGVDAVFLVNRALLLLVGIGALVLAHAQFARGLRGERLTRRERRRGVDAILADTEAPGTAAAAPGVATGGAIADLGMRARAPGFLAGAWTVARAELKELRSQPGLYLFVPLILTQTIGEAFFNVGAFDTPLLHTAGTLAAVSNNTVMAMVGLLILFYTVESLEREKRSGFAPIALASPVHTGALLLGKAVANVAIVVVILTAALVGCMLALAIQGKVPLDPRPFLLVWGLLMLPTYVVWTAFIMAVHALVENRYTTYAVGLGALTFTVYRQVTGQMNWVGNWNLWEALRWSDLGWFEIDRVALLLNRVLVLGLAALFIALAFRLFARASRDASRVGARLAPSALARSGLRLAPFALVPLIAGTALFVQVQSGYEGKPAEKKLKDYWRRNMATWRDSKNPTIVGVDLDLELDPRRHWFHSRGHYTLVNRHDVPLRQVALTRGLHWKKLTWSDANGDSLAPEDRVGLVIFTPPGPLAPGDSVRIGFDFEGRFPDGATKNGGGASEFILPSGVVLTSFTPSFVPVVGYLEEVGVDKDNRFDSREYPDDFHQGITPPAFGAAGGMTTRIAIRGPADYRYNSVGTQVRDEVQGGTRTTEWRSDHPVKFFNVVAGRWQEKRGNGTVIYYHPTHAYNIEEMSEAIDASRRWFSEWFMPFPWQELKLSEFPALAFYAQGFPTNITFSEGIGFLTKSDPRANAAFMVTAHEAAHQWWGNILLPGQGPGGDILSEGMAHFSTILLFDQVKGAHQRIEFCKRIEDRYGDRRQVDSERPLVKIDGSKRGDQTVTYDKGGWVFWMLLNHMGRARALAGVQDFIRRYETTIDYPVLQDFVAVMREHAADREAFDTFVGQWFFSVVVPEYKVREVQATRLASGAASGGAAEHWEVSFEVENIGTSTMPVEVAAVRGTRFPKEDDKDSNSADMKSADDYREARQTVVMGPGAKQRVKLQCSFEPERVIVDPDARVLQLNRDQAAGDVRITRP
jgi:hypothetical protein